MPADEGFPAYLPTRLPEFYERAGKVKALGDRLGSISVIGAVSPRWGLLGTGHAAHEAFHPLFLGAEPEFANARHYPAISWIDSYSEYTEEIRGWWEKVKPDWARAQEKQFWQRF